MADIAFSDGRQVGDYKTPYIIAELGSNHNGDMAIAKKLIDEAKNAGCDCVKFQSWTKDTIFSKQVYDENCFLADDYRSRDDFSLEQIVDEFSVSGSQLQDMSDYCIGIGIDFTSTPFSKQEVDHLIDNLKAPFIKVASMDLNNYPFLTCIARKGVPVVLSTGMSSIDEIDMAVKSIEDTGNNQIILLHCVSLYPPKDEDVHLNNMDMLRERYPSYPIGFSDHSIGIEIPIASAAMGACIIEKHFTLDKDMFGWDHKVSATPDEMKAIVTSSRRVALALGNRERVVSEQELIKRTAFRRSVVAAREIPAGKILEDADIDFKRPGTGISPGDAKDIIGMVAGRDIEFDELVMSSDLRTSTPDDEA